MIAGPFVCLDYTATPTVTDDGNGGTVSVYPPLPGLYYITDLATFARSSDVLTPYRVSMVPAQHVMGGDDPANPVQTVTLHFADQATASAVVDPVNALPPVPAPQPSPASPGSPARSVQSYRFKAALRLFPSPSGVAGRTVRDDVEAARATWPGEVQDAWEAPEFYRDDPRLNDLAATFAGGDPAQAQTLLDAIFSAAAAIA